MSDGRTIKESVQVANSKTTQNEAKGFELGSWLDHTHKLDQAATPAPWTVRGSNFGPHSHDTGQVWGLRWRNDAEWIAYARQALPAATKALRAVLDLHEPIHALDYGQPVRGKRLTHVCTGCGQDDGNWNYWPCPTVKAITAAIGEREA